MQTDTFTIMKESILSKKLKKRKDKLDRIITEQRYESNNTSNNHKFILNKVYEHSNDIVKSFSIYYFHPSTLYKTILQCKVIEVIQDSDILFMESLLEDNNSGK